MTVTFNDGRADVGSSKTAMRAAVIAKRNSFASLKQKAALPQCAGAAGSRSDDLTSRSIPVSSRTAVELFKIFSLSGLYVSLTNRSCFYSSIEQS